MIKIVSKNYIELFSQLKLAKKLLNKNLLEELSKIEHDQWIEWSKSVSSEVSDERKERWEKYWVPYDDLSEEVKEQDRVYARKVLDVVNKHTGK